MDYEKEYKDAIEKLRGFYRDYDTVSCLIDVKEELANLFPELKESEDENVRKAMIKMVHDSIPTEFEKYNITKADCLVWLRKQGEQKPAWSEEDEKILKDIIIDVKYEGYNNDMQANFYKKYNWLKSIKQRIKL